MKPRLFYLFIALFLSVSLSAWSAETPIVRVPVTVAYSEPEPESLQFDDKGVMEWKQAGEQLVWYGKITTLGKLTVRVKVALPALSTAKYRLTIGKQTLTGEATGAAYHSPVSIEFGTVDITSPGYQRIALQCMARSDKAYNDVYELELSGTAAQNAHFNTMPVQRGAPSVHLSYPIPKETKAAWFYNEVTAKTDPLWSYYMACGWHRGYFGIQVNSPTERRIIFSVWDSGSEAKDRNNVGDADKVKLLAKGDGVFADSFGNEGTGGHSHLVYPWKTGETYRFLVSAEPSGSATIYTGYFYFPERKKWGLIARFRAPKDGSYLRGLYSFDEDFSSANGQRKRLAEFGSQWIKSPEGNWTELTDAVFTHTGKDARTDYDAGSIGKRFYLTGGGFVDGTVKFRDKMRRHASGKPPTGIFLP